MAECPEVAPAECATTEIPEHLHDQDVWWFRGEPAFSAGLGLGFIATASVPFDLRDVTVQYLTLDEQPYDPPYGDIHHRTETLVGPADGQLAVKLYRAMGAFTVGGGIGTTLPLGRTEADPYVAGAAGQDHQHMQLGTGTWNPVASFDLVYAGQRWGAIGWAFTRVPLYENDKGYLAPTLVSGGAGPSFRATPKITVLVAAEASWESQELWNDIPYSGKTALGASAAVMAPISEQIVLQGQLRANLWEQTEHHEEEGYAHQPLTASVGLAWTFGHAAPEAQ